MKNYDTASTLIGLVLGDSDLPLTPLELVCDEMTFLSVTEDSEAVIRRLDKIYDIFERHKAKGFDDPDFKDAFKK